MSGAVILKNRFLIFCCLWASFEYICYLSFLTALTNSQISEFTNLQNRIYMKVIVIGGTGATGRELIECLIGDKRILRVTAFVRNSSLDEHPKLKQVLVDFDRLEEYSSLMVGDVAISCLGTTLKDAGSKQKQFIIDHDIPLKFAEIAYKNGVKKFLLLSSMNANSESHFFYSRMKGMLEQSIRQLGFSSLLIFQPSLLIRPNTNRLGEKLGQRILELLNNLGFARNHAPIQVSDLAKAMRIALLHQQDGVKVFSLLEINDLASQDAV
jgi:uncharacterized protein YbjT (DUF2867 family)